MIFIIAEAGVNHNGHVEDAIFFVSQARRAGADAIKFQAFNPDIQATPGSPTHDMLRSLHLRPDELKDIADKCGECGIEFMCTPFDIDNLKLVLDLGVKRIKLSSQSVTNLRLLKEVARARLPVIISNGMCTDEQMDKALEIFGDLPVTILYCVSKYPTPAEDIYFTEIERLRARFGVPVGFSDHTKGIFASIAAAAMGATVIEKHITKSRDAIGPDHAGSVELHEMEMWVREIRAAARFVPNPRNGIGGTNGYKGQAESE